MPNFNGIVITNSGKTLLSKAQEGKELRFTKMQLGSANDITNPSEKTTVTAPFLTTEIRNVKLTTDGSVRISTFISNENLTQSYVWREIGLFALDPDTEEEILYAYKCAGENGETIPAGGGSDVIEKIFDIVLKVQNATNISAIIDDSTVFISRQEIVQELDDCAEEQYKVPSAQLFYEINTKQNETIKDIQGEILYNNSAGSSEDITLNDDTSKYTSIKILAAIGYDLHGEFFEFAMTSTNKVWEQTFKIICASPEWFLSPMSTIKDIAVTGNTIKSYAEKCINLSNSAVAISEPTSTQKIKIFKVIGYK